MKITSKYFLSNEELNAYLEGNPCIKIFSIHPANDGTHGIEMWFDKSEKNENFICIDGVRYELILDHDVVEPCKSCDLKIICDERMEEASICNVYGCNTYTFFKRL